MLLVCHPLLALREAEDEGLGEARWQERRGLIRPRGGDIKRATQDLRWYRYGLMVVEPYS
jgi:hypothetical protein